MVILHTLCRLLWKRSCLGHREAYRCRAVCKRLAEMIRKRFAWGNQWLLACVRWKPLCLRQSYCTEREEQKVRWESHLVKLVLFGVWRKGRKGGKGIVCESVWSHLDCRYCSRTLYRRWRVVFFVLQVGLVGRMVGTCVAGATRSMALATSVGSWYPLVRRRCRVCPVVAWWSSWYLAPPPSMASAIVTGTVLIIQSQFLWARRGERVYATRC